MPAHNNNGFYIFDARQMLQFHAKCDYNRNSQAIKKLNAHARV